MKDHGRTYFYMGTMLFLLSIAAGGAAAYVYTGVPARTARLLSSANEALNKGEYDQAGTLYRYVLSLDGENTEALEGLMQVCYRQEDRAELYACAERFLERNPATDAEASEKNRRISEMLTLMHGEEQLKEAADAYYGGDAEKASELLLTLPESLNGDDVKGIRSSAALTQAREAWLKHDLKTAWERLCFADDNVAFGDMEKKRLRIIGREYMTECMQRQEYDEALQVAAIVKERCGGDALSDLRSRCINMKNASASIDKELAELAELIEADDVDGITSYLQDNSFKQNLKMLKGVYYSPSLRGGNGKGLAVYRISNRSFIYSGTMKDGKREGDGLWLYSEGDGKLCLYRLNWVNDLPEGEGTRDQYSALVNRGEGGQELDRSVTHETDSFTLKGGVMYGDYHMRSEVLIDYPYAYGIDYTLSDGYCPQILPGEYPELIDYYLSYPCALAGWTEAEAWDPFYEENYTTTIWYVWNPSRWTVEGVEVMPDSAENRMRTLSFKNP